MKVYELMHLLSQSDAGKEVKIYAYLTVLDLTHGKQVNDKLLLEINDFDPDDGCIITFI